MNEKYSGFPHDAQWGHRASEPNKAVICSLALARLRTDIKPDELSPGGQHSSSTSTASPNQQQQHTVGMAQKLLLFWRKPARRCWWEGTELVDVPGVTFGGGGGGQGGGLQGGVGEGGGGLG